MIQLLVQSKPYPSTQTSQRIQLLKKTDKWELMFLTRHGSIAHGVSTGRERDGPKPVICKFVRQLVKGKVLEVHQ